MKRFPGSTTVFALSLFALLALPQWAQAAPPAVGQSQEPAKAQDAGCPCECGPDESGKMGGHGQMHGGHEMHPMMEGMKRHMEEVRRSVAALREHEKKLEGIVEPAAFRKAAIEHFRMLDDLQESHVKHMDSMMEQRRERMPQGTPPP